MSRPSDPVSVKLVVSVISPEDRLFSAVFDELAGRFGEMDYMSRLLPFAFTDYYQGELGSGLKRRFVSYLDLIAPERLPDLKIYTNSVEDQFSEGGKRRVNIDPGYLTPFHLILGTGKSYAHRPYLRSGIYADLTLIYKDKMFQPLEWTYPDYAGADLRAILEKIRKKYIRQLKERDKEK